MTRLPFQMILLAMAVLAALDEAAGGSAESLGWPSREQALHSFSETDSGGKSCLTTVTASTTPPPGVSLMQALSVRARLASLSEVHPAPLMHNASIPDLVPIRSGEDGSSAHVLRTATTAVMTLLQQGRLLGDSALAHLHTSPAGRASTVAYIFVFILLLIIGSFAFVALFHPGRLGGLAHPFDRCDSEIPSELLVRQSFPNKTTAYFPVAAAGSPRFSVRSGRRSPEATSKLSPGTSKLAKGLELSSDEEKGPKKSDVPAGQAHFCPDLIVPQHCECILVLPLDLSKARSSFPITDVNGSPVLRIAPQQQGDGQPWQAAVTTSTGETLVKCCAAKPEAAGGEAEFHLLRAGNQFYAKLLYSAEQDRYRLYLHSGAVLHFWGNFDISAVNITDDDNRLLATTEVGSADFDPQGTYARLRVAPLADVGVALCGLLCIGQHMASQKRRASL